jgi:CsoR family transcriptional regulator, copper-sensing transcriptional repressor
LNDKVQQEVLTRLSKIEGQIKGIGKMVEEHRYCVDILYQISAVQGALDRVARQAMRQHLEGCVAEAFQSKDMQEREKKVDELIEMFSKFGK